MKVALYMAISLNGIIARENNEEDSLSSENWTTLVKMTHKAGCLIWGRKTLESVKSWGESYLDDLKEIRKVIVSTNPDYQVEKTLIIAQSPKEALAKLSTLGFKKTILSGGSRLNAAFAKDGLIDEIVVNVEPVVIGKGIPLFWPEKYDLRLKFIESKQVNTNIIQLRYAVKNK